MRHFCKNFIYCGKTLYFNNALSVIHNYFRSKYFQSEEAELFFCKLYITQWLKISSIVSFLNIASRASYIFLYEKDLNFRAKIQDFIYKCIFWPFLGQNCKMRHFWVIFKQFSISFQMSSQPYFLECEILFRQFPSRHFAPFPQLQDFYLRLPFFSSF